MRWRPYSENRISGCKCWKKSPGVIRIGYKPTSVCCSRSCVAVLRIRIVFMLIRIQDPDFYDTDPALNPDILKKLVVNQKINFNCEYFYSVYRIYVYVTQSILSFHSSFIALDVWLGVCLVPVTPSHWLHNWNSCIQILSCNLGHEFRIKYLRWRIGNVVWSITKYVDLAQVFLAFYLVLWYFSFDTVLKT